MAFIHKIIRWWNTTCYFCLQIRKFLHDIFVFFSYLIGIVLVLCFGLFVYWIFFDTDPIVHYGTNGRAEFYQDRIIFHVDAVRMRDCQAVIYRKISGCGQIDLPMSHAVTPIGNRAPPVSFPIDVLFQSFSREQLSGNVCTLTSTAIGYCNPAQRLLKIPVISQSAPIVFVPVPRAKTWQDGQSSDVK